MSESIAIIQPRARLGDPETSIAAAKSVKDLRPRLKAVLNYLRFYGPMTHEQLVEVCGMDIILRQSPSGIRTRCSELVAMGLVRDTGERRKISTGRFAIVWGVK